MSSTIRQSELFAAQDWDVLYRAFTEINFNASDPASINAALRNYLQTNYAEDFNDWIASSEFVAIIDLLSWLAGTLAFKTDINARENFLESAEARESILRLARFLSYNPRRNQAARGLLKVVAVQTDDDVVDSLGENLLGQTIRWNDTEDSRWYERFLLILNSAFIGTNPWGKPVKTGNLSGQRVQSYKFNASFGDCTLDFQSTVSGQSMPFSCINTDFDDVLGYVERTPDNFNEVNLLYKSDGNGNSSGETGFFMGFKQGTLNNSLFSIENPTENQLIDIDVPGINQSDVWVQTINDDGSTRFNWEKVPAIFSENTTFNTLPSVVRNIYSVVTRDEDRVTLRFADGRFGNAPSGLLRVWYRTSNGIRYQIRPSDMVSVKVRVGYVNRRGVSKNLTLTLALQNPVSNSTPSETEDEIKRRAPQVYSTQNRMVSGEDYNAFPLQTNLATKIKAVSRIYSGHNRFIDLNDPTGNFQDTNVFSDDGIFYKQRYNNIIEVPLSDNRTDEELVDLFVQPSIKNSDLVNYIQDHLVEMALSGYYAIPNDLLWNKTTDARFSSTGWITVPFSYLVPGATILLKNGNKRKWVGVVDVIGTPTVGPEDGFAGPVTLSEPVETGWQIVNVIPPFGNTLSDDFRAELENRFNNKQGFSLWYDYAPANGTTFWFITSPQALGTGQAFAATTSKVMTVDLLGATVWRFSTFGLRYIFESLENVQFFFDGRRTSDQVNRLTQEDIVKVLKSNSDLNNEFSLRRDYDLAVDRMLYEADGYADPVRIAMKFRDIDEDGFSDDPDTFYKLVSSEPSRSHLFWKRDANGAYKPFYDVIAYQVEAIRDGAIHDPGTVAFQVEGETRPNSFWIVAEDGSWKYEPHAYRYGIGRGPNVAKQWFDGDGDEVEFVPQDGIMFQYKHYAPSDHRIDPSKTNIIDIFVLLTEYDTQVRLWVANGSKLSEMPVAPTEFDIRAAFVENESFKMFSDDIVWKPVKYKYLFGPGADDRMKAQIKVIKLPNSILSDGEIKSRIIRVIDNYFLASRWDFGETFFFSELSSYIHQQLQTVLASCVIVPTSADGTFGNIYEVKCRSDELFISTATVSNVIIIDSNTPTNLRMN